MFFRNSSFNKIIIIKNKSEYSLQVIEKVYNKFLLPEIFIK